MEEEFGEDRIISPEMNRKSGEVRVDEIEDREGRIQTVESKMKASSYGKLFKIETDEKERALVLKAQQEDITDKNLEELFHGLVEETKRENYTRLNKLKLDIKNCQGITDEGVKVLAIQIGSHLKNITNLHIDFSYCPKISDSGVTELAVQLGSNLQSITQLHLNFFWCTQITDSGFKELATQIGSKIKDINQLYLNFAYCDQITDSGFKELSNQFRSNLKNLTQLELYFSACHKVTDAGFRDLANQIGLRTNITLLHLYFSGCKITDSGLKELTTQIGSNLKNLAQLSLDFSYCENITVEGVKQLTDKIGSNLKNTITYLRLDFGIALSSDIKLRLYSILTNCKKFELI